MLPNCPSLYRRVTIVVYRPGMSIRRFIAGVVRALAAAGAVYATAYPETVIIVLADGVPDSDLD